MRKYVLILTSVMLVIGIGATFWVVRGLSDFDLARHSIREVSFELDDAVLSGTLVMPMDATNPHLTDIKQRQWFIPLDAFFVSVGSVQYQYRVINSDTWIRFRSSKPKDDHTL